MKSKMKEFIASLLDASLPEEQQTFLLSTTDGDIQGGDNLEGTCYNETDACGYTNDKCINKGDACLDSTNYDCTNLKDDFVVDPDPGQILT